MKKTVIIILATLITLLLIGMWVYLLIYGKPQSSEDRFSNLNIEGDTVTTTENTSTLTEAVQDPQSNFRQISFRPVAGAGFTETGIRYVEQGTGHIYEVHLETNKETLISGTTLPQTTHAVFSNNGMYVAITAFTTSGTHTAVGNVSTSTQGGEFNAISLPENATEIAFDSNEATLFYILKEETGTKGYMYDLVKNVNQELFSIPLRDIRVIWGDTNYIYTTPTGTQTGYVYSINTKGGLSHVTNGKPGLVSVAHSDGIVTTSITEEGIDVVSHLTNGEYIHQFLPLIPEKCIHIDAQTFYCAVPQNTEEGTFPDSWYMGTISYSDTLWLIDTQSSEARHLLNLVGKAGVPLDVHQIGADFLGVKVYLINKTDNTLWLYDRSI